MGQAKLQRPPGGLVAGHDVWRESIAELANRWHRVHQTRFCCFDHLEWATGVGQGDDLANHGRRTSCGRRSVEVADLPRTLPEFGFEFEHALL